MGLVVILGVHLLLVCSLDSNFSSCNRRLLVCGSTSQFAQYSGSFEFLLKTLQRLIDRFVFLYVDNDHC